MKLLGTDLTRNIERDMFDYMPREYEDYRESRGIIQTQATELEILNNAVTDVLAQLFVDTATWGVAKWEEICGLPVAPTTSLWDAMEQDFVVLNELDGVSWNELESRYVPDLEERRSSVKAKLRGFGTVTKQNISDICDAYTGGAVKIHEYPTESRVVIEFVDERGVPGNIEALQEVLGSIMPAHLLIEYLFKFVTWTELDSQLKTWDVLDAENLSWDEFQEVV